MASITAIAHDFFAACETGKGWDVCKAYCAPNATFAAQAEPLAGIKTLAEYADRMKGLLTIMPDGSYELKSLSCVAQTAGRHPRSAIGRPSIALKLMIRMLLAAFSGPAVA